MCENYEGVTFQPPTIKCHICGKKEWMRNYNTASPFYNTMIDKKLCFSCAFWMDKIENAPDNYEVIKGHYYIFYPHAKRPENIMRGSKGKELFILRRDGSLIKSNNVWHQGEIPKQFREKLPNTATFISLMTYQKLENDNHRCMAKGCWDRYNCFRYDLSCEHNGAFNQIPTNHHIGDEHCPSFINISEIQI